MTVHVTPAEYRKRAAKHTPEHDTQDAILAWLGWMRVRAVRIDTSGQPVYGPGGVVAGLKVCSHVGTPDILAWLPWGQACAIEVKRAGQGRTGLRFSQARWIVETAKLSPLTMILIAESMLDVEAVLKEMLDAWRDYTGVGPDADTQFLRHHVHRVAAQWRAETNWAVSVAKQRLARGPQ